MFSGLARSASVGAAVTLLATMPADSQEPPDLHPAVYRLSAGDCRAGGAPHILTAFAARVGNQTGLVTALHGVAGCERVTAENIGGYTGVLQLTHLDVRRDVAFLTTDAEIADAIEFAPADASQDSLKVIGYPRSVRRQLSHPLEAHENEQVPLWQLTGTGSEARALEERRSPDINAEVLSLRGNLQPGYSGAPVLDESGRVTGIGNGGLAGGSADINWAMPAATIEWSPRAQVESALDRVANLDARLAFTMYDDDGYDVAYARWRIITTGYASASPDNAQDWGAGLVTVFYPGIMKDRFGVGLEASAQRRTIDATYSTLPGLSVDALKQSVSTFVLAGTVRAHLLRRSSTLLDPFASFTIGIASHLPDEGDAENAAFLAGGLGVEWRLGRRFGLTTEARLLQSLAVQQNITFNPFGAATFNTVSSTTRYLEIRLGLSFQTNPSKL